MKALSKIAAGVSPSATLAVSALAKKMKAEGKDVIGFGAGEPDFATPDRISYAGVRAICDGKTRYTPAAGMIELRQAICDRAKADYGLEYEATQAVVASGAKHTVYIALAALVDPGDEVIVPAPYWVSYYEMVRLFGGVPVVVNVSEEQGFQLTPEQLEQAITDKTKAIILTSPNNPTGCMYTKETLDAVHDILKDKPIFVLCDDVYRTLVYTEGYHSFAEYQDMRDRIIVINSFSKPYAMTGWRLGYCMADAPIMDRIQVFHQYAVTSIPSFVQKACVTALGTDTSDVVEIFRKRRDYVYKRLVDMGLEVQEPEGAFYMFINIQKYGMDSQTFCEKMLKEGLVGVIPGIHFGTEGYMRLSYCYSDADLKEGLDRIEKFIKTL